MEVKEPNAEYRLNQDFQLTELGSLPHDWSVSTVGEEFHVQLGKMLDSEKNVGTPKPFLGNRAVQWGRVDVNDIGDIRMSPSDLQRYRLKQGDLLVCEGGEVGRSAIWRDQLEECYYQKALHRLRAKRGYSHEFMAAVLEQLARNGKLQDYITQTSIAHLPKEKFVALPIPRPATEDEQCRIAHALSNADSLIDSLEQLLTKKRQIKQGVMQELLTGKRRLRLAHDWHPLRLGDIATLNARIGWQGLTTAEYKERGDYLLVTGTEFNSGRIRWDGCHYVDQKRYDQDKNIQLTVGDVLVTKDGTIGKVALIELLPMPVTLNSGIFVVRPKNNAFHPGFFYYLLTSSAFSCFLSQLSAGSTINHLYQKDFVDFKFRAPKDLCEQRDIFHALDALDSEIAAIEARLTKARSIKQAMAQALLTGRIRLVGTSA